MAMSFTDDIAALYASKVANDSAYKFGGTFGVTSSILGGSVSGLTITAAGDGYTAAPTVTFTGGGNNGSGATVEVSMKATSATLGGTATSGFAEDDTLTLSNGVVLTVTGETGGVIDTVSVTTASNFLGTLVTAPTIVSTSGAGVFTGATVALKYGVAGLRLLTLGGGYTSAPTVVFTGSNTTPATATATVTTSATAEKNILTLIEVLRAYAAGIGSRSEAKLASEILQRASAEINGSAGATNTVIAERVQNATMRYYADPRRKNV